MSKDPGFVGTDRYAVHERVGKGGMGVVYRAVDLDDGTVVALKLLNLASPQALYQFKQEFRALADIGHPNLVRLHELSAAQGQWFFTMEYVEGVHFFDFVRGSEDAVTERPSTLWNTTPAGSGTPASGPDDPRQRDPSSAAPTLMLSGSQSSTLDLLSAPASAAAAATVSVSASHQGVASLARPDKDARLDPTQTSAEGSVWSSSQGRPGHRAQPIATPAQFERLRQAMLQLVRGIKAIHTAGYVHCDIKNTNILVDAAGRVVILDYGLVTGGGRSSSAQSKSKPKPIRGPDGRRRVLGTPLYMAPELFVGGTQTPASDMYAVGVLLYMVLSGLAPYVGGPRDIREQKLIVDPPALLTWTSSIPPALEKLSDRLLSRDPRRRPSADEVIDCLGENAHANGVLNLAPPEAADTIVGREDEIAILQNLLKEIAVPSRTARTQPTPDLADPRKKPGPRTPRIARLHGDPGIGKSTILAHFEALASKADGARAIVLSGRCHEREAVPYKALDALIDALAIHLASLPMADVGALLPVRVGILARMFPVLERVEAIKAAPIVELQNPRASRREAVPVLRELLTRLGAQTPLVLMIDDVQWGDRDSGMLLSEVLEEAPPPLLLVLSYRTREGESSPFLSAFGARLPDATELALGPLSKDEVHELVRRVLGRYTTLELVERIANECGGNAFFVGALAAYLRDRIQSNDVHAEGSSSTFDTIRDVTLEQVLLGELDHLSEGARRLVEILAVAGGPITQNVAQQAARLLASEARECVNQLRLKRLARTRGIRGADAVEPYHDRVRETVWHHLDDGLRIDHHRRIAWALLSSNQGDPEQLARHFDGAHDFERAGPCYAEAGHAATRALAFDRAASHFDRALALLPSQHPSVPELRVELANALANSGRGRDAASAYLEAAKVASLSDAMECRQRAAALMLDFGLIEEARRALTVLLAEHGIPGPTTGRMATLRTLLLRAQLRLRGFTLRLRDPSEISPRTAQRIDVLWSVAIGFVLVHPTGAHEYCTRSLLEALRAGDERRIARSMGLELALAGTAGRPRLTRNLELMRMAQALSERVNDPYTRAMVALGCGFVYVNVWNPEPARRAYDVACDLLRNQCVGKHGEANRAELSRIFSYYYLGELKMMRDAVRSALKEAERKEEWQMATSLKCGTASVAYLVDNDVSGATEAREAMWEAWKHGFGFLRFYWDAYTRLIIDLYAGRWEEIWHHVETRKNILFHPVLENISLGRISRSELLARSAIGAAIASKKSSDRRRYLRYAIRFARRMERERLPTPTASAQFIRATVLTLNGRVDEAVAMLKSAEAVFSEYSMAMHLMAARRRRGQLIGGDEGKALIDASEAWFVEQTVAEPNRFAQFVMPGDPWPRAG
ncbi:MAG: protein kinase [Deltaproteobacteria bacterium]|nr:protein kinase [Deltaproteobacteria bacterium]